ncbi:MAG TPA: hypothetical protein HA257_04125 [Candidatus Methanoperedenaceae archaeon]|nr:hypothetical protein [Candidatus Methanoperedenaceae archaeon]
MIEIGDNTPESALYHVIFHEESPEKKLPLTAIIFKGDIRKYWAGKAVDVAVYERFLKGLA